MIWMRFGRILGMEGFRKAMMNGNWICINLHLCPQGVSAGDECVDVDKSSTTITTWMNTRIFMKMMIFLQNDCSCRFVTHLIFMSFTQFILLERKIFPKKKKKKKKSTLR